MSQYYRIYIFVHRHDDMPSTRIAGPTQPSIDRAARACISLVTFGSGRSFEFDQVLGVGLGVMVRYIDGRIGDAVNGRVVQCLRRSITNVGSEAILYASAKLADSDTVGHDILKTL
jgi:hypothetical protein